MVKPSRGPEPNLMEKSKNSKLGTSRSQNTKRLTPIEAYYSKQIPAADRRRRRVAELEKNLLGHPLALFPTLENGLSPELYEEIVDILDPDLLDMAESETSQSGSQSTESGKCIKTRFRFFDLVHNVIDIEKPQKIVQSFRAGYERSDSETFCEHTSDPNLVPLVVRS